MLKTTRLSEITVPKLFGASDNEIVEVDGGKVKKTVKNLSKSKKSKNKKSENPTCTNIGATGKPIFLTPSAKEAFKYLRQAFIKVPTLRYFDLECHIRIETDVSSYAIGEVLSQLSFDWIALDGSNSTKSEFGQ